MVFLPEAAPSKLSDQQAVSFEGAATQSGQNVNSFFDTSANFQ